MSKAIFFIYSIIVFLFFSCTHSIYPSLSWQSNPVVVDGNMNEWSNPLRFYDYKSKINYSITNDRKNLYICLKISDVYTQFRIMEGGMECSIDTADKKIFPVKVIYPPGSDGRVNDESKQNKKIIENFDILKAKQIFLGLLKEIEVKGFKYPVSGIISSNSSFGISVSINWDKSGVMVYEAMLPFTTFYKDEIVPADTNKVITLKIHINALPMVEEMKKDRNTQDVDDNIVGRGSMNGSVNGNMNEGMNGGINGAGTMGYGNNNRQNTGSVINPMSESLEFKIKMKFSYQ